MLNSLYKKQLLYLAYKNYYNLVHATLQSLFMKPGYCYELRNKITYVLPKPNTDFLKKSICYQAITLWNSLDKELKSTETFDKFKKSVKASQL